MKSNCTYCPIPKEDSSDKKFTHNSNWRMEERLPQIGQDTDNANTNNEPLQTGLTVRQPL